MRPFKHRHSSGLSVRSAPANSSLLKDHNEVCVYPEKQRRSRKRKEREQELEDRLARMEVLLQAATRQPQSPTAARGDINVAVDASSSPFMAGAQQEMLAGQQVSESELLKSHSIQGPQQDALSEHSVGAVVHVASLPAAQSNSATWTYSPSHEQPVPSISPEFRNLSSSPSHDLDLPTICTPRQPSTLSFPPESRTDIASATTTAPAALFSTSNLDSADNVEAINPRHTDSTPVDEACDGQRTNSHVRAPVTPPSTAPADDNGTHLGVEVDTPYEEVGNIFLVRLVHFIP